MSCPSTLAGDLSAHTRARSVRFSVSLHRFLYAREAALLHLYPALGADELLEQPPDPIFRAVLAPDLPASGALPEGRPEETAYLLPALCAKAADHDVPLAVSNGPSSRRGPRTR